MSDVYIANHNEKFRQYEADYTRRLMAKYFTKKDLYGGCSEKNSWSKLSGALVMDKHIEMLKKTVKRFYGEKPIESKSITRIVNQCHFERLTGFLNDPLVPDSIIHAQKEAPADMQCKDKFLLQSAKVNDGVAAKDINAEMMKKYETDDSKI
ncbi:hypothetical protein G4B88_005651 [Cannabis sativa]|uniref:Uncharacterized protein n=1 Tax=Cannabis sativa TaxID=3483 RepID=A0A7J6GB75_CANSA|nr:hypothetical protein G4B88_005651 [Cannabis sativa]